MSDPLDQIQACTGFQWDRGNAEKNRLKHGVTSTECEEVFFHEPLIAVEDVRHSDEEPRLYVLGKTDAERWLFVVFTIRDRSIRVISARDMSRRERNIYEQAQSQAQSQS
jgi:uncharacterized DUF497 family protein